MMNDELRKQLFEELEIDLCQCMEAMKVTQYIPDMGAFADSWVRAQRMLHPEISDEDELEKETSHELKEFVTKIMLWKLIEGD